MTALRSITPETARRLAVSAQALDGHANKGVHDSSGAGKNEIMQIFRRLGCIQIDPIRAVETTQLLVLWSRLGYFDIDQLDVLLWEERQLFEYWAHAASIVLTDDFPIYWRHMRDWAANDLSSTKRAIKWIEENDELRSHILTELKQNGPRPSKAFNDKTDTRVQTGGWTSAQASRIMLMYLWEQGFIMVSRRDGLNKYWDLRERCLPDWTPRDDLSWPDTVFRAAQKSLQALGVGRPSHIKNHYTRGSYPGLEETLDKLVKDDLVEEVQIKESSDVWTAPWYIHRDLVPLLDKIEAGDWEPRTALLSPFDNLICHRERTEELFDFHFRIEIYVPKAKRQYGYYVLPLLHGDRFIGRIDPKMDRKKNRLIINAIYTEDGEPLTAESGQEVAAMIQNLATFLGAKEIEMDCTPPIPWRSSLAF